LSAIDVKRFTDGEINVQVVDNVRGGDVFILQSTCPPVNDNLMELLIIIDAMKRSSARRITAVIPYYGYARQDRKAKPRVPITAKLVADLLHTAGAQRIVALDLHAGQIQGFFNMPVDHLLAAPVIVSWLRDNQFQNLCIVAPDAGGVERARLIAEKLGVPLAIIDKRRSADGAAHALNVIGAVEGADCVVVDDMCDTAGTLTEAITVIKERGARRVFACVVHGVLSGPAIDRITNCEALERIVVTDTIPLSVKGEACSKITQLSISHIIGEAIHRIHREESVSSLFL
jgi:ribose-phosphate pyrophosphokinase